MTEMETPLFPQKYRAKEDEMAEERITAMLVPIKTTLKNWSGFRIKSDIIKAFLFPFFAKYLRCNLLVDITAVSTPEKKAATNKHINNIKGLILIHHSVKIILPPLRIYPLLFLWSPGNFLIITLIILCFTTCSMVI